MPSLCWPWVEAVFGISCRAARPWICRQHQASKSPRRRQRPIPYRQPISNRQRRQRCRRRSFRQCHLSRKKSFLRCLCPRRNRVRRRCGLRPKNRLFGVSLHPSSQSARCKPYLHHLHHPSWQHRHLRRQRCRPGAWNCRVHWIIAPRKVVFPKCYVSRKHAISIVKGIGIPSRIVNRTALIQRPISDQAIFRSI